MTSSTAVNTSGLKLQHCVQLLESFASTKLAADWDNVGLLVEPSSPHKVKKLFLTNDLTEDVLNEAIAHKADMILSYHPPIFSSIKRITQSAWKNRILIKAIENRIAIYSPHTSYDAVKGGVNDWLISCFDGDVTPITPNEDNPENGVGRICQLTNPVSVDEALTKIKVHLGLDHVRLAQPSKRCALISSVASCAGSGASVLRGVRADLYLTGEMSHHDVLDAVANQRTVVLCEHSNTERGFLRKLKIKLTDLMENKIDVIVSEVDKDPLMVV